MSTPIIRTDRDRYAASSYDESFCLKPPWLLWPAVLYLSRAITLPIAVGIGSYAGVGADAIALCRRLWSMDAVAPSLITMVFVLALCRRTPKASRFIRWIWANGRMILILSASVDLVIGLISAIREGELDEQALASLVRVVIDGYFLSYFLVARRLRDTFADFPEDPGSPAK